MRQVNHFLLLFLAIAFFGCCKDDDDSSPSESNETFSDVFFCKINGEDFDPRPEYMCSNEIFQYYPVASPGVDEGLMLISGRDCPTNKSVAMGFEDVYPFNGYMDFENPEFASVVSPIYFQLTMEGNFVFETLVSGHINVTTFSPWNSETQTFGKIEGTFEFSVTNEEGDSTVHITEGYFRFHVAATWSS